MLDEIGDMKVDIGVLKSQITILSSLCEKMDKVIEKLVEQHDRHIAKVYTDMDNRRLETDGDIKEIHERIDTVLDKVQQSELRIMAEIKELQESMSIHSANSKEQFEKLNKWIWMIAGGMLVVSWLISHTNIDTILKTVH
jgi:hypothetical protein